MAFLSADQLAALQIERMIFHVVGPDEAKFVLLEEIEPGPHMGFFLDRVRSTHTGLLFDFTPASPLLKSLQTVHLDIGTFAQQSKDLAKLFQVGHGRSTSPGVFMLFVLKHGEERLFALLKYDHETVLSYTIEATEQGQHALIAALQDTFVKSPEALQKSAIARLTPDGGELCVRDRSAPSKITQYFQQFLGATRRFQAPQLTLKLVAIAKKVARQNEKILGPDVLRNLNQRIYEAIQNNDSYGPDSHDLFLANVYGPLPEDSKVRNDFDIELKRERIEGESFDFDKPSVPRPSKKQIVTQEGIQVIWDREYDANIKREEIAGGRTRITIESGGVKVEDDYAEPNSRKR